MWNSYIKKTTAMNFHSIIYLFVLFGYLTNSCKPKMQNLPFANHPEIDSFVEFCFENGMFNGSVLVVKNDTLVYKRALGFENRERNISLSDSSRFYLASVSKPFTAMAIMQLVEAGKLTYADPIKKYYPELPQYSDSVTIRHLLNHTSGIPNHYDLGMQKMGMTNMDVLSELTQHPPNFSPGTRYQYSNSGYILLAMLIERISGMSFNTYMQKNIFAPLGMEHTLIGEKMKPIPNKVMGTGRFGEEMNYPFFTTGAGGMYSTIDDLYLWERALYTEKLVTQGSLQMAFQQTSLGDSTAISDYGFGWHNSVNDAGKTEKMFHTGGAAGYASFIYRDIINKHAIIILSSNGRAFDLGLFADTLTGFLEGASVERPKVPMALALHRLIQENDNLDIENAVLALEGQASMYTRNEEAFNDLGYHYLEAGAKEKANTILKVNTLLYPESPNVYDSYAESFLALGDLLNAEKFYLRAYTLDSTIKDPKKALQELKKSWTK